MVWEDNNNCTKKGENFKSQISKLKNPSSKLQKGSVLNRNMGLAILLGFFQ